MFMLYCYVHKQAYCQFVFVWVLFFTLQCTKKNFCTDRPNTSYLHLPIFILIYYLHLPISAKLIFCLCLCCTALCINMLMFLELEFLPVVLFGAQLVWKLFKMVRKWKKCYKWQHYMFQFPFVNENITLVTVFLLLKSQRCAWLYRRSSSENVIQSRFKVLSGCLLSYMRE
jgi:hypothetical protein